MSEQIVLSLTNCSQLLSEVPFLPITVVRGGNIIHRGSGTMSGMHIKLRLILNSTCLNQRSPRTLFISIISRVKKIIILMKQQNSLNMQKLQSQNMDQPDTFFYHPTDLELIICTSLGFLSMIFSLIIPIMYYTQPKTRQYPAILLVMLCVVEMMEVYHLILAIFQLRGFMSFDTSLLTNYTFFGTIPLSNKLSCYMNMTLFFIGVFFQQALYICWCVDIALTLKKPFLSTQKRLYFYVPLSLIATTSQILLNYDKFKQVCDSNNTFFSVHPEDMKAIAYQNLFYMVSVFTIFIAIQAIRNAKKSGNPLMGIKIRYLRQQIVSQIIILLIWSFPLVGLILINDSGYLNFSFAIVCSQGIILGLLRLQESFFRRHLARKFKQIVGVQVQPQKSTVFHEQFKDQLTAEAWNIPLASLLAMIQNQEVIASILDGIVQSFQQVRTENQSKMDSKEQRSYDSRIVGGSSGFDENLAINDPSLDLKASFTNEENCIKMKVIEYAPTVFTYLRHLDQISREDMMEAFNAQKNVQEMQQLSESLGKSGSFFFTTHNRKFIIKTIRASELQFFINKMLKKYTKFIRDNRKTFLAKIYGCYSIRISNVAPVNLILMENTLYRVPEPDEVFDIKGSLLGRKSNSTKHGKDIDLLESEHVFIEMSVEWKQLMINQVKKDTEFLKNMNIMDYSMLVGIKYQIEPPPTLKKAYSSARKIDKRVENQYETLSFGIIDYFQEFNFQKYIENKYKSLFSPTWEISSIEPEQYRKRFVRFIKTVFVGVYEHD